MAFQLQDTATKGGYYEIKISAVRSFVHIFMSLEC